MGIEDYTLWFIGAWIILGFLTLVGEVVFEGEFVDELIWYFPELDKTNGFIALIMVCVGMWPLVWMYEALKRIR